MGDSQRDFPGRRHHDAAETDFPGRPMVRSTSTSRIPGSRQPLASTSAGHRPGHRNQCILAVSLGMDCRDVPGARTVGCLRRIGAPGSHCTSRGCGPQSARRPPVEPGRPDQVLTPMKSTSASSAPLADITAALSSTTEILARELGHPSHEPPRFSEFEWRIARAVAAMHGVSSLLCDRLRWEGPAGWRPFLAEQRAQSVGRHAQIARSLDAIDSQARRDGVAFPALKGAALHARAIYAAGERPMGDIDLLVRGEDAEAMGGVLEACGYAAAFSTHRHEVFQPRVKKTLSGPRLGEHVDNPINVELHTRVAESLPVREIDITQYLLAGSPHPGLNAYPTAASLMLHLLLHAAGNMRARALRLIQLHDIALLAARFVAADWRELLAMRPAGRKLWWAYA